jgi:tetratricopeptide (TPR) repeat protein
MSKEEKSVSQRWTSQGIRETDPERKMHYFTLALELNPYDSVALNQKGMLHHRKGEFEKAIGCYDRLLNTAGTSAGNSEVAKPGSAAVLYNKSLALKCLGKNEAALNFIKKAVRHDPDNEKLRKLEEQLLRLTEETRNPTIKRVFTEPEKIPVNVIYNGWQPPGVMTLLAHAMKCSQSDIKYYKGFGEDLIKEKSIQDKLSRHVYCCTVCTFQHKNVCRHSESRGMAVSATAICRRFRPKENL